jgi:hypothetical protein
MSDEERVMPFEKAQDVFPMKVTPDWGKGVPKPGGDPTSALLGVTLHRNSLWSLPKWQQAPSSLPSTRWRKAHPTSPVWQEPRARARCVPDTTRSRPFISR